MLLLSRHARIPSTIAMLATIAGPAIALADPTPFTVVIDPGHGGSDLGAVYHESGRTIAEKDVTLSLALEAAKHLKAQGIHTVLTRREDRDLAVPERTAIANRIGANLFISIHMNSSPHSQTKTEGIETYILNTSTDASSKRLADLENSVLDGSAAGAYQQTDVGLIVKDLMLDANRKESQRLACAVQNQVLTATSNSISRPKKNRGVKQAMFYVLLGADMPSILLETGFLNNSRDRQLVTSPWGRNQIGQAIASAVRNYRGQPRSSKTYASLGNCKIN